MFAKLASFAYEPDTDFRIGYQGPRALQGLGRCTMGDPFRVVIEHQQPGKLAGTIFEDIGFGSAQAGTIPTTESGQPIDFNAVMAALNALEPSRASSFAMATQGIRALNNADAIASEAAAGAGEVSKRNNIRAHLNYYSTNPQDLEQGFYDIKNWTIQAFVMYNASAEVAQQSLFWPSVYDALVALPSTIGQAVGTAASAVAGVAGQAAGGFTFGLLQGLFQNPVGIAVLLGAGYLLFIRKKGA